MDGETGCILHYIIDIGAVFHLLMLVCSSARDDHSKQPSDLVVRVPSSAYSEEPLQDMIARVIQYTTT